MNSNWISNGRDGNWYGLIKIESETEQLLIVTETLVEGMVIDLNTYKLIGLLSPYYMYIRHRRIYVMYTFTILKSSKNYGVYAQNRPYTSTWFGRIWVRCIRTVNTFSAKLYTSTTARYGRKLINSTVRGSFELNSAQSEVQFELNNAHCTVHGSAVFFMIMLHTDTYYSLFKLDRPV
jgi:hypothetical protein